MRFPSTVTQASNAVWTARHESRDMGAVEVRATTRAEAVAKLRDEIRYRLEICPCTGETYQHIAIEIVEADVV